MSSPEEQKQAWLDQVSEAAIDPQRPIVDAHHHLWEDFGLGRYSLEEFWRDTQSGHNITQSVYLECGTAYHTEGPDHLRSVGETSRAASLALDSMSGGEGKAAISAIVSHADLRHDTGLLEEVLAAHRAAGGGLFRGVRQALARAPEGVSLMIPERLLAPAGLAGDTAFRRGVATLGQEGYCYETWHYHTQQQEFLELARAVPDTLMVLDHLGHPIGVDRWSGRREEVFSAWKDDIAAIAQCDNVYVKLGGMAMPDNGWGWHENERPPTSDEFAHAQADWYLYAIEKFGVERCMFESNFPMDRMSLSYPVYWNGVKKIVADFSEAEKTALFSGTARKVYDLR